MTFYTLIGYKMLVHHCTEG